MRKFFRSMLSQGGISSKRFWGSVVLVMLCFSYVWCTMNSVEMVGDTDAFIALAGVLLGIESVVSPFIKSKESKEEDTTEEG